MTLLVEADVRYVDGCAVPMWSAASDRREAETGDVVRDEQRIAVLIRTNGQRPIAAAGQIETLLVDGKAVSMDGAVVWRRSRQHSVRLHGTQLHGPAAPFRSKRGYDADWIVRDCGVRRYQPAAAQLSVPRRPTTPAWWRDRRRAGVAIRPTFVDTRAFYAVMAAAGAVWSWARGRSTCARCTAGSR